MTQVVCHRYPAGGGQAELGVADLAAGRFEPACRPAEGRSAMRPIVAKDGRVAWYELRAGDTPNNPLADVQWMVAGTHVRWPRTWGPRGHVEVAPGGTRWVHAVWRSGEPDYSLVTTDATARSARAVSFAGVVEPSWTRHGILALDKRLGRIVLLGADGGLRRTWPMPDGAGLVFDPHLSPDGTRVVVLSDGWPHGLLVHEPGSGWRWLYRAELGGTVVSDHHWLDDSTLLGAARLPGRASWSLTVIDATTGEITPVVEDPAWSYAMPRAVPAGASLDFGS